MANLNLLKNMGNRSMSKLRITDKELSNLDVDKIYLKIGKLLEKNNNVDILDNLDIMDSKECILDENIINKDGMLQFLKETDMEGIFRLKDAVVGSVEKYKDKDDMSSVIIYSKSATLNKCCTYTLRNFRYYINKYNLDKDRKVCFRIVNPYYMAGRKYISEEIENYFSEHESVIPVLSENFMKNRIYNHEKFDLTRFTYEDIYPTKIKSYAFSRLALVNFICYLYEVDVSKALQDKYNKNSRGSVARAFETKLNINKETKEIMESSLLNKTFRYLEIDNDVDLDLFRSFERAVEDAKGKFYKVIDDKLPELRLRKLGKHHANGVYFPHVKCICVDVRHTSSFFHEVGHYLDYNTLPEGLISMSDEFFPVVIDYREKLKTYGKNMTLKKLEYYSTPTEIFARAFELYLNEKRGVNDNILGKDEFSAEEGYVCLSDESKAICNTIFSRILDN